MDQNQDGMISEEEFYDTCQTVSLLDLNCPSMNHSEYNCIFQYEAFGENVCKIVFQCTMVNEV